jgi:16S rRNA (uracil1498-N3)-methyltransferase
MKIHRFIGQFKISKLKVFINDQKIIHQIKNVLKLTPGEKIILVFGEGREAVCEITEIDYAEIVCRLHAENKSRAESGNQIILFASILKKDNFEWVAQKVTEVGATKIVPIISARTIKKDVNMTRLRRIATEAAEQCGRSVVPEISVPISFDVAIDLARENDINYVFEKGAPEFNGVAGKNIKITGLFIGPEGGWTPEELEQMNLKGFVSAGLGENVMRGETAAIVATFLAGRTNG